MSSSKIKPVVPVPKRAHGFTIDSIMGREPLSRKPSTSSEDSDVGEEISRRTSSPDDVTRLPIEPRLPALHPALSPHVKQLLLSDGSGRINPELLALRSHQAWAFGAQTMGSFPGLGMNGSNLGFAQHVPVGFPQQHPALAAHPGFIGAGRDPRDPVSMYPWVLGGRPGPGMMGLPYGHPDAAGFFFHPYRKPKRIRTAFSPTQLLKLEHAFEKNHYVVGQERKELASKLNLSETQVKVWFQNRRTKHKRVGTDDNGRMSADEDDVASSSCNIDDDDDVDLENSYTS